MYFVLISSPANAHANYYSNFDVSNGETSVTESECSIKKPRTIEEVMNNVIVYVEVRSGAENRTSGVKSTIANLGAKVNDRLLRYVINRNFLFSFDLPFNFILILRIMILLSSEILHTLCLRMVYSPPTTRPKAGIFRLCQFYGLKRAKSI